MFTDASLGPAYLPDLHFAADGRSLLSLGGRISLDAMNHTSKQGIDQHSPNLVAQKNSDWVEYRGKEILWLPHEYRSHNPAVAGHLLAIGTATGRVVFIRISASDLP